MTNIDPEAIVKKAKTIAMVGAFNNPEKYSNEVASYLMKQGYHIIPINPSEEVLGEGAYETVEQILEQVDVVDVFLSPEKPPEIVEDAVQAEANVLWLQEGIENEEARRIAEEGELAYVEDRCMCKSTKGYKKLDVRHSEFILPDVLPSKPIVSEIWATKRRRRRAVRRRGGKDAPAISGRVVPLLSQGTRETDRTRCALRSH